jgi:hypothetical protein
MNQPIDADLYAKVKSMADEKYSKPSAYKSGWIVKTYKKMGGKYTGKKTKEGLTEWFSADWQDVGNQSYPVYRPTKRVSENTPLTLNEIDPINLRQQIKLKQLLKGRRNLPPFKRI